MNEKRGKGVRLSLHALSLRDEGYFVFSTICIHELRAEHDHKLLPYDLMSAALDRQASGEDCRSN